MRLLDPPDDDGITAEAMAAAEEADYRAWRARVTSRQEADRLRWASREGLMRLSDRPQGQARDALRRSLPSSRDARRLFDLVQDRLGDRAELDAWAAPGERCLLLHDAERPGWMLAQRVLYLRANPPSSSSSPPMSVSMNVIAPEHIKRFARRFSQELDDARPPRPEEPPTLVVDGQPGTISFYEGASYFTLVYGDDGAFKECSLTAGDTAAFAEPRVQPFTIDPCARPPQVPPISLLLRPELQTQGVDLDTLADMVVAMAPLDRHQVRVWVPCPQPGTAQGTWARALNSLRQAAWDDTLPDDSGWLVIDGWSGDAVAVGPTFDAAVATWRQLVARVQPLPPIDAPAPADPPEDSADPDSADPDSADELLRLPPPLPEDVAVASIGPFEIRSTPPVELDWPPPRPDNVAAAALPWPLTPVVPPQLVARGFDRVLRLFGEQGDIGFTFIRTDPDGYTAVGDDAVAAIDLDTLDAQLDALLVQQAQDHVDVMGRGNPYIQSEYPVMRLRYRVWDDLGRSPELQGSGAGWSAVDSPRGWGLADRHYVLRVRIQVQVPGTSR